MEPARPNELSIGSIGAALATNSLPDLARSLAALLNRSVNFVDQEGALLGAQQMTESDRQRERSYVQVLHGTGGLKRVQDSVAPLVLDAVPDLAISRRLACPIRIGGGLCAIVWVDEESRPFDANDLRATEHAAIVAALHIAHMRALNEQEERLGYAFVGSLLEGKFEDTIMARNRAAINGWNEAAHYRACLILLDEPLPLQREGLLRVERFVQRLRQDLRRTGAPELLFVSLNQITVLLPESHDPEKLWQGLGSKGAAMAVSRVHRSPAGMALAWSDVQSMVDLLRPGRVHHFDEVLFPQALLGDPDARKIFLDKRLRPLREEKTGVLLETLEALCDEGFQLAGASRRLGIHISTLRYRLERIETVLAVSLEDQAIRFELQVALAMLRFTERN